jgi:hypothetical protein
MGAAERSTRAKLAAAVGGKVAPSPGARILHFDSSARGNWQMAAAILSAGCSVLVEGAFADGSSLVEAIDVAGPGVSPLGFWIGPLPGYLDPQFWQALDATSTDLAGQAIEARLGRVSTSRA